MRARRGTRSARMPLCSVLLDALGDTLGHAPCNALPGGLGRRQRRGGRGRHGGAPPPGAADARGQEGRQGGAARPRQGT
eukprot:scaffold48221_cov51-Phaeocystis_antarctica.AAC.4